MTGLMTTRPTDEEIEANRERHRRLDDRWSTYCVCCRRHNAAMALTAESIQKLGVCGRCFYLLKAEGRTLSSVPKRR